MKSSVWRISAVGAWALTAAFQSGCGPVDRQSSEAKIYGGSKVPDGGWPSTVALVEGGSAYCSGTAVTPNIVITAAHCAEGMRPANISVYVGEGKDGGRVKGQFAVSKIVPSPLYDAWGDEDINDIAYIVLKDSLDLPESAYIKVLVDPQEIKELLSKGHSAKLVGFGERNSGAYGSKWEVETTISKITLNEIWIGGAGKDTCYGDSGGPVYGQLENGEWRVYGVTSRGGACGTGGVYGLIHANICWVQKDSGVDLRLPRGICDVITNPGNNDQANNSDNSNDAELPVD